eukprot:SAG31_NODE_188_length_20842_cov_31.993444_11_plen_1665_part_00
MSDEEEENLYDERFMSDIGRRKASTFFDDQNSDDDGTEAVVAGSPGSEGVLDYKSKPRYCRMGVDALTIGATADKNDDGIKSIVPLAGCNVDVVEEFLNIELPNEKVYELKAPDATAAAAWAAALTARASASPPVGSPRKGTKLKRVKSLDLADISEDQPFSPGRMSKSSDDPSASPKSARRRVRRHSRAELQLEREEMAQLEIEEEVVRMMTQNEKLEDRLVELNEQISDADGAGGDSDVEEQLSAWKDELEDSYLEKNLASEADRDKLAESLADVHGRIKDLQETVSMQEAEIADYGDNIETLGEEAELIKSEGSNGEMDEDLAIEIEAAKEIAAEEAKEEAEAKAVIELEKNREETTEYWQNYFAEQIEQKEHELTEFTQQIEEANVRQQAAESQSAASKKPERSKSEAEAFIQEEVTAAVKKAQLESDKKIQDAKAAADTRLTEARMKSQASTTDAKELQELDARLSEINEALADVDSEVVDLETQLSSTSTDVEAATHVQHSVQSQIGTTRTKLRNSQLQADSKVKNAVAQAVKDAVSSQNNEDVDAMADAQSKHDAARAKREEAEQQADACEAEKSLAQKNLDEAKSELAAASGKLDGLRVLRDKTLELDSARESRLDAEESLANEQQSHKQLRQRHKDATQALQVLLSKKKDRMQAIETEIERDCRKEHAIVRETTQKEIEEAVSKLRKAQQDAANTDAVRVQMGTKEEIEESLENIRAKLSLADDEKTAAEDTNRGLKLKLTDTKAQLHSIRLTITSHNENIKANNDKISAETEAQNAATELTIASTQQLSQDSSELETMLSIETNAKQRAEMQCNDLVAAIAKLSSGQSVVGALYVTESEIADATNRAIDEAEKRSKSIIRKAKEDMDWNNADLQSDEDVDKRIETVNLLSEQKWRKRYHQETNSLREKLATERKSRADAVRRQEIAVDTLVKAKKILSSASGNIEGNFSPSIVQMAEATAAAELREIRATETMQQMQLEAGMDVKSWQSIGHTSEDESRASSPTQATARINTIQASRPSTPSDYSPEELYSIGITYRDGIGVSKDYPVAFKHFEAAADQGNVDAVVALADCYQRGLGVQQDEDAAVQLYEQASGQGHTVAMLNLSLLNLGMTFSSGNNSPTGNTYPTFRQTGAERARNPTLFTSKKFLESAHESSRSTSDVLKSSSTNNFSALAHQKDESPPVSTVNGMDDEIEHTSGRNDVRAVSSLNVTTRDFASVEQRALRAEKALERTEREMKQRAAQTDAMLREHQATLERTKSELEEKLSDKYAKRTRSMEKRLEQLEKSMQAEATARATSERQEREAREAVQMMERKLQAAEAVKAAALQARVQAEMQTSSMAPLYPVSHNGNRYLRHGPKVANGLDQNARSTQLEMYREKIQRQAAEQRTTDVASTAADVSLSDGGGNYASSSNASASIPRSWGYATYRKDQQVDAATAFTPRAINGVNLLAVDTNLGSYEKPNGTAVTSLQLESGASSILSVANYNSGTSPPPSPPGSPPLPITPSPAAVRVEQAMSELREILTAASTPKSAAKPRDAFPSTSSHEKFRNGVASSSKGQFTSTQGSSRIGPVVSYKAVPPAAWEPVHVCDWASATFPDWGEQYQRIFLALRVTGAALLSYNMEELGRHCGIENQRHRRLLLARLHQLDAGSEWNT